MNTPNKIYHLVPARVEGEFLMPLNDLKSRYPELYQSEASKYHGREQLMMQKIPILDCLWNDVLQFSPVHPEQIRDAMLAAGFGWRTMLFFEIDPDSAGINQSNAVTFLHKVKKKGDFTLKNEDFMPFVSDDSCSTIPAATVEHFIEAKKTSTQPFLFLWVPHVLFRGQIKVNDLKIIEV